MKKVSFIVLFISIWGRCLYFCIWQAAMNHEASKVCIFLAIPPLPKPWARSGTDIGRHGPKRMFMDILSHPSALYRYAKRERV